MADNTVSIDVLKAFKFETNLLLMYLDNCLVFLTYNIHEAGESILKSEETQVASNYKQFYYLTSGLVNQVHYLWDTYNEIAAAYSIDPKSLTDVIQKTAPILQVDSYGKTAGFKKDLIKFLTDIRPVIKQKILTPIEEQIRALANNAAGQTVSDNKQPANKDSAALYKTSQAELKNQTAQSIISNRNRELARQQSEKNLNDYLRYWVSLKPITDALTDSKKLQGIANALINASTTVADWFNRYVLPNPSVSTGIMDNDQQKRLKFTLSNLLLGKELVQAKDPATQTNDYVKKYWREKTRKKFGNFPFCDETLVNGQWVPKKEAESKVIIDKSKQQILLKLLKEKH